jgi:hypothetical protein
MLRPTDPGQVATFLSVAPTHADLKAEVSPVRIRPSLLLVVVGGVSSDDIVQLVQLKHIGVSVNSACEADCCDASEVR